MDGETGRESLHEGEERKQAASITRGGGCLLILPGKLSQRLDGKLGPEEHMASVIAHCARHSGRRQFSRKAPGQNIIIPKQPFSHWFHLYFLLFSNIKQFQFWLCFCTKLLFAMMSNMCENQIILNKFVIVTCSHFIFAKIWFN
jgi:hypothetical protein